MSEQQRKWPENEDKKPENGHNSPAHEIMHVLQQNFKMTARVTEELMEKIAKMDLDNDYFSQGFQSKVYKVDVNTPAGSKHFLILKKRLEDQRQVWNDIIDEYRYHTKAKNLLRKRPDITKHVDVPKIWSIINDDEHGYTFIVMDYKEGKTVFAHNVTKAIPHIYETLKAELQNNENESIEQYIGDYTTLADESDFKLKKYAMNLFGLFCRFAKNTDMYNRYFVMAESRDFDPISDGKSLEEKINRISSKVAEKYATSTYDAVWKEKKKAAAFNMVMYLNENQVYHNDTTSRNVLIWNDNKVYLLDFGNATDTPKEVSQFQKSMTSASIITSSKDKYNGKILERDLKIISMIDNL